jgi:hypothetical protein
MDDLAAIFAPMTVYLLQMVQRLSEQETTAVQELPRGLPVVDVASEPHKLAG